MKYFFGILATIACLAVLFVFGYSWRDIKSRQLPTTETLGRLVGMKESGQQASAGKFFKDSYDFIQSNYYRQIDSKELKFAAMSGLMSALGDPHTVFMEPVEAKDFADDTRGTFGGIGARLGPDPMGARIPIIFEDGPAKAAGLKPNDLITHVDGKSVAGMAVEKIVEHVRGPVGKSVTLTIMRAGVSKPFPVKVKRAKIIAPTVEGQVLPKTKIGYMSISMFAEPTANQFETTLSKLERSGIRGLIVDVRGNPGGLLESARDILSRFVSDRQVVTIRMRGGKDELVKTYNGEAHNLTYPVVVLIDEDSASAAEIFAGVLRDYRIASLVGEHTYGKASVQNVFPLIDGSSAKVTIAKYILPGQAEIARKVDEDGQYISGGLNPDYEMPMNLKINPTLGDPKTDTQLQKAIEVIEKRLGGISVFRTDEWFEQVIDNTRVA